MRKISINRNLGPIVFLGSMNAMPMMYAMELKKLGFDILYFVDEPKENMLSRPENHFRDISYPYPKWIMELNLKSQIMLPFARAAYTNSIVKKAKKYSKHDAQVYFLNGFFIALAPFLKKMGHKVISLSHGSDLDSWADESPLNNLNSTFTSKSIFKFIPRIVGRNLINLAISRQFLGLVNSDKVIYFPIGFNESGDRVVKKIIEHNVDYHPRYDISFEPLKHESREFKNNTEKLVIFSGVRFTYLTFTEGNKGYSKGNDIIIKGLARFYQEYKNIEIHFVEKGIDFEEAKKLCKEEGISDVVKWHKEMKFTELLKLYNKSDICFDQVGQHWISAIGAYALFLGKPLIANDTHPVEVGLWPTDNPVLTASNEHEVFDALKRLISEDERHKISIASKVFAEQQFTPEKIIYEIFEF